MNNNQGFIKIFRKIIDWEWFKKPNTRLVFEYFLYKANYEDKMWRGIEIKRGQLITSLQKISEENGITMRQTRTALNDLQTTNNIAIKTTNKYTLVTIINYDFYQSKEEKTTNKTTNKMHTKRQANDTQNDNNIRIKEIKNIRSVCVESNTLAPAPTLSELRSYCYENDMEDFDYENFYNYYESNGWLNKNGSVIKNWKAKLKYWYNDDKKNGRLKKIDTRRRLD